MAPPPRNSDLPAVRISSHLPALPRIQALDLGADISYRYPVRAFVTFLTTLLAGTSALGGSLGALVYAALLPLLALYAFLPEILGSIQLGLGRTSAAAETFRRLADRLEPTSLRGRTARSNEGACWLNLGDIAAGKKALASVQIEDLGGFGGAVQAVNLSHLYWQLGDAEAALALAEGATTAGFFFDRMVAPHREGNRAQALVQLGRFSEAEEILLPLKGRWSPPAVSQQLDALRAACALFGEECDPKAASALSPETSSPLGRVLQALAGFRVAGELGPVLELPVVLPSRDENLDAGTQALAVLAAARAHERLEELQEAAVLRDEIPPGELRNRVQSWLDRIGL